MIKTFRCKDTQALFEGQSPNRFRAFQSVAERKLSQLHAAATLEFLRSPPGNRLEPLSGDREGEWNIRVNNQWRVCFRWADGNVFDVECRLPLSKAMIENRMRPVHPGEILREDFLAPLELSVNALAQALRIPASRLHEVVNGRRGITPDTALRLARYFGGDAQSWLNLQTAHDLRLAQLQRQEEIERDVLPREAA